MSAQKIGHIAADKPIVVGAAEQAFDGRPCRVGWIGREIVGAAITISPNCRAATHIVLQERKHGAGRNGVVDGIETVSAIEDVAFKCIIPVRRVATVDIVVAAAGMDAIEKISVGDPAARIDGVAAIAGRDVVACRPAGDEKVLDSGERRRVAVAVRDAAAVTCGKRAGWRVHRHGRGAGRVVDDQVVGTRLTVDGVRAASSGDLIGASSTVEEIVAGIADNRVLVGVSLDADRCCAGQRDVENAEQRQHDTGVGGIAGEGEIIDRDSRALAGVAGFQLNDIERIDRRRHGVGNGRKFTGDWPDCADSHLIPPTCVRRANATARVAAPGPSRILFKSAGWPAFSGPLIAHQRPCPNG